MSEKENNLPLLYIEFCLSGDEHLNVYTFCKKAGIKESEFYKAYGSLESLKKEVFKIPFNETLSILQNDDSYKAYNAHEKILSFFYTWIQQLTEYRSFLLQQEKTHHIQFYNQFCNAFQHEFDAYATNTINESIAKGEIPQRQYLDQTYSKALWGQLLFLFKFWLHDDSPGFDKTDAAIEKSVRVAFDLMGNSVVDSMFDFGRFMLGQFQRK